MLLILKQAHKQHLVFLTKQTTQVLQDFCKLALDYLQKGPNLKFYSSAAQKLEVQPEVIKSSIQGLVNFFLESCRHRLNVNDFRDSAVALGFTEEQESLLSKLYAVKKQDISKALADLNAKSPQYQHMEWRFEAQKVGAAASGPEESIKMVSLYFMPLIPIQVTAL
ncbi:COMM domain-containing protein 2-like isoform X3 [Belonocnema kinseyi]|uniref:COMM domain-containing protein 2-like isoform X3 n=1 Tax=Belonocnema kinseyi TaxID=2817044 RepID=UPI00143CDF80|nr:COMM domain-containing protein 2-like isoform X3 [Belonocnema kinseyi]